MPSNDQTAVNDGNFERSPIGWSIFAGVVFALIFYFMGPFLAASFVLPIMLGELSASHRELIGNFSISAAAAAGVCGGWFWRRIQKQQPTKAAGIGVGFIACGGSLIAVVIHLLIFLLVTIVKAGLPTPIGALGVLYFFVFVLPAMVVATIVTTLPAFVFLGAYMSVLQDNFASKQSKQE